VARVFASCDGCLFPGSKQPVFILGVIQHKDSKILAVMCVCVCVCLAACVASRPGQSGRCDGYILEGKELEFYQKKLKSKKTK